MTDEEKKALESFKRYINKLDKQQEYLYNMEDYYKDDIEQNELLLNMLHSVLNLIQEQNEEIENYKKLWAEAFARFTMECIKMHKEHAKDLELLNEGWKAEMAEKDKVIDEMAKYINSHIDVISRDIEESICCHNLDGKCINRKCEECVSKYFYGKVEEK